MLLSEVRKMTLDQVFMMLSDRKTMSGRSRKMSASEVKRGPDGKVKGRAADGTTITGVIRGKSLARQLMEEEEARRIAEESKGKEPVTAGRRSRRRNRR